MTKNNDNELKRRLAKACMKAEISNIGGSGSKTYVDQIFDFIRVYDPNFMTIQSDMDVVSEIN